MKVEIVGAEAYVDRYGSENFWSRGYFVDTVGRNEKLIAEYIKHQFEEGYAKDQSSLMYTSLKIFIIKSCNKSTM